MASAAYAQEATVTGNVEIAGGAPGRTDSGAEVVVWLTPVDAPASLPPPQRARLIQKGKSFEPRLLVLAVGSTVEFPNLDPLFHNVFSYFEGKRFDLGLYEGGTTRAIRLDRAGVSYIFCNIHPEMSAVIVALETPFYARLSRPGRVGIAGVPPGRYRLRVWYEDALPETLRGAERTITVSSPGTSFGTVRIEAAAQPLRSRHRNKYDQEYPPPAPPSGVYTQQ